MSIYQVFCPEKLQQVCTIQMLRLFKLDKPKYKFYSQNGNCSRIAPSSFYIFYGVSTELRKGFLKVKICCQSVGDLERNITSSDFSISIIIY